MCELLGMSANVPTDIRFSFTGLAKRGGATGPHKDGWGIAFYSGRGARCFHDPEPSAKSELAHLLANYPIKSKIVLAHVRRANRGKVALENTHPFTRELWGRVWTFAHNGQIKGVKQRPLKRYLPVGSTDSEHAFCWMLDQLAARWKTLPKPDVLDAAVEALCRDLHESGVFNAMLSDSRTLYAYCSKRLCYLTRRAPFGPARLLDEDLEVDFAAETTPNDIVTVIATRPLTRDETWTKLERGAFLAFRDGLIAYSPVTRRAKSSTS